MLWCHPFSAFAALSLLLAPQFAYSAQCKIAPQTTVPLTLDHNRAIVPLSINETPGQFEIDTGSDTTTLSAAYAKASHVGIDRHAGQYYILGAGNQESLPAFHVHARHIQIGTISFQDWEFAAASADIPSPTEVSGILGRDFLHYFDIELDIQAGKMTIWRLFDCSNVQPPWHGDYDAIPMKKIKNNALTIPIWIDNAFLDMEFDTGAGGLLLSHAAANRAGASDAALSQDQTAQGRGLGGTFNAARHHFGMLLVGSKTFKSPMLRVDLTDRGTHGFAAYDGTDGLIGLAQLKSDRMWISFTTGTLFVQSAPTDRAKR